MHKIAKQVAHENAGSHIVLENLNGIRRRGKVRGRRMRRRLNSWNFARLQALIEYKARLNGSTVEYVNPRNTSRVCSRCGCTIGRFDWFCQNCGLDRHVNAARNILARSKHRMWRGIGSAEGSLMRLASPDEQYSHDDVNERENPTY
jgi:putative transposase